MSTQRDIKTYYNQLAERYDKNRFGNTYGRYIDQQERRILASWLADTPRKQTLDLGCGTGRLLDFAHYGIDFSSKMLEVASEKYPDRVLLPADLSQLPLENSSLQAAFSAHVFMHLDIATIRKGLKEVHRILEQGGIFIFDIPNLWRRRAIRYEKQGWHGNTALSIKEIEVICGQGWELVDYAGVLLFPIHHVPKFLRMPLCPLDSWLAKKWLRNYASYQFICLKKR